MLAVSQEKELHLHADFSFRYSTGHVGRLQLPGSSYSLAGEEQGGIGGKERAAPRGGRAAGPYDGRRPCARVARERELTLVRALPYPNCSPRKYYLPIKYYAEIVLSPNKILCGDSTISK